MCIPGIGRLLQKVHKNLAKIAKPLTLLTRQQVKFEWTPEHQETFMKLKDSIIQALILHYCNPRKKYIIYTDASDYASGAQLTQEHDVMEFPITFPSHTFSETYRKWSMTEQEAYGVYYAITKWNYYLQGADITDRNDHKPLAKFLNRKNANNKVNRWDLDSQHTIVHLSEYQEILEQSSWLSIMPGGTDFHTISINQHGISFK